MTCTKPPAGWRCTRDYGHDGPCAAVSDAAAGWNYDHPWWPLSLRRYLPKRYLRWSYLRALRKAMADASAPEQRP
jgi:hypothetical protein